MVVQVSLVLGLISAGLSIYNCFANNKKVNKTDGFELGKFMGEMRAEIAVIKEGIVELKQNNKEIDDKIEKAIEKHLEAYHNK